MASKSSTRLGALNDVNVAIAGNDITNDKSHCGKTKRRMAHSERQKREKEALLRQLAQLLDVLERAKTHHKQQKAPSATANSYLKKSAERHLLRRLASEGQQRWLQAAVAGRAALIDDLVALVQQQIRTITLVTSQSQGLHDGLFVQPNDELRYAMSIYEIAKVYQQTDLVFRDATEDPIEFHCWMTTEHGTAFMEFGWRRHFPFSFERTQDAIWLLARIVHRQDQRETYNEVEDPDNTVAVKLRVSGPASEGKCESVVHRFVQRRFMTEDRMIFVWRASIIGDGSYRGMQMDETGWCMIRPSVIKGQGTFAQACVRQVPLHLASARAAPEPVAKQFGQFVGAMLQENMQEVANIVENILLDEALEGLPSMLPCE